MPHQISVFFPTFFWLFWFIRNQHDGEEGQIICVEQGRYSKQLMYTILFEKAGVYSVYAYFAEDLEFLEPSETK